MNNGEEMADTTEIESQNLNIKGINKAVLVVGGAGYIGSHTCKELRKNGYTPVVVDIIILAVVWEIQLITKHKMVLLSILFSEVTLVILTLTIIL